MLIGDCFYTIIDYRIIDYRMLIIGGIIMSNTTKKLSLAGMFLALNIILSSFGVPVPGGKFYLNDIAIVAAAIVLDPLYATLAGGVGAFLGDFFFYPTPMFVSLAVRALQSFVISWLVHKNKTDASKWVGVLLGAVIMVVGYSLGRAFIYSTPEYAVIKLPYQILQSAIGVIFGSLIANKAVVNKIIKEDK